MSQNALTLETVYKKLMNLTQDSLLSVCKLVGSPNSQPTGKLMHLRFLYLPFFTFGEKRFKGHELAQKLVRFCTWETKRALCLTVLEVITCSRSCTP